MVRSKGLGLAVTLIVAALFGTGYGESADLSALVPQTLPAELLMNCGQSIERAGYSINWLSALPGGGLFLVRAARCRGGQARAWIVRMDQEQPAPVLTIAGSFRLLAGGSAYPVVESEQPVSPGVVDRERFVWHARGYQLEAHDRLFDVAGARCGTRLECDQVAHAAFENGEVARALAIWRTVDQASWI